MNADNVVVPVVHVNGTSAPNLIGSLNDAWEALDAAAEFIRKAAPNGRDYYPAPGRMALAEAQHRARLAAIRGVQDNIQAEIEAIGRQADGRG